MGFIIGPNECTNLATCFIGFFISMLQKEIHNSTSVLFFFIFFVMWPGWGQIHFNVFEYKYIM